MFGDSGSPPQAFRGPGANLQGQILNDILVGNVLGANPEYYNRIAPNNQGVAGQLGTIFPTTQNVFAPGQDIAGTAFPSQPLQFQSRTPFQFTTPGQAYNFQFSPFDPRTAVGDAFTPQAQRVQNVLQRQGQLEDDAIREDLNARGLLTAGATTEALANRRERTGDQLTNALLGLAGQQASQQLGAAQFGANLNVQQQQLQAAEQARRQGLDFNRQLNQAAEIFRQQGATDQQAIAMAQDAMGRRQQALQEYGVANRLQRQPFEDLLRLYAFSTGGQPGSQGSPGLLPGLAGGVGAGLGSYLAGFLPFCLPKGTQVELEDGSSVPIESVKIGDEVAGGTVVATQSFRRPQGHKFFRHTYAIGDVVMSAGHPSFDEVLSREEFEHESQNTYDILTDSGFYYVNGVKLGSTIGRGHAQ